MKSDTVMQKVWVQVGNSRLFVAALFLLVSFLSGQGTGFAANVALRWDAVTGNGVTGYKVYYQANSSVQPFSGTGAAEGTSPIDVHNTTTATLTGLDSSKSYYFAVTAYDATGHESVYSTVAADLDLAPPAVFISSPANSAVVNGIVSVAASASDNTAVSKVEFYVNGTLQATDTSTPYMFSWNTAAFVNGSYLLTTKAYDTANNAATSSAVTVTVNNTVTDTIAPTASITSPSNNATISGTVAVTAGANDNVGVSRVDFYINGVLRSSVNSSPYSFNWNTTAESNGVSSLSCKAYDAAGHMGVSTTVAVTISNTVSDVTAPTINTFTMPSTASLLTVNISSFTATDNVGVTGYMVSGSATAPLVVDTGWSSSAPSSFTFSSAGPQVAYAWVKDAAGHVSASRSASVTITLSNNTYTISDALLALQIGSGKVMPTSGQIAHLDVAPVINGKSVPNGKVDTGDAIALLSRIIGKTFF